jgi:hypothetical protein
MAIDNRGNAQPDTFSTAFYNCCGLNECETHIFSTCFRHVMFYACRNLGFHNRRFLAYLTFLVTFQVQALVHLMLTRYSVAGPMRVSTFSGDPI